MNHTCHTLGALLTCFLLSGFVAAAQAPTPDVNTVKRIQTVNGFVEIEVQSSREFPVRDEVVVLRIGEKEFQRSRSPENGSLKTLIFMIDPEEFASLADGETMTVKYGRSHGEEAAVAAASPRSPRWDFGKLNKALHRQ